PCRKGRQGACGCQCPSRQSSPNVRRCAGPRAAFRNNVRRRRGDGRAPPPRRARHCATASECRWVATPPRGKSPGRTCDLPDPVKALALHNAPTGRKCHFIALPRENSGDSELEACRPLERGEIEIVAEAIYLAVSQLKDAVYGQVDAPAVVKAEMVDP